jgi:hypothetical protein
MTTNLDDKTNAIDDGNIIEHSPADLRDRPKSVSRRALLRGGVTAMPAILTLHSGAALARSSNLIGQAPPGTTDEYGRTLCLDTTGLTQVTEYGTVYDLREPPSGVVNVIPDRN